MVTLQCALIETFATFREGKIYKKEPKFGYEYNDCENMFSRFLGDENIFSDAFTRNNNASSFYKGVRCGLMHSTKTTLGWKINASVEPYMENNPARQDINNESFFVSETGGIKIIFRNQFQDVLVGYFNGYKSNLADPNNTELRKFFARKLDDLFDIPKDETFDWWKHICECKYCNAPMNVEPSPQVIDSIASGASRRKINAKHSDAVSVEFTQIIN
jgi:hypothetical protein